MFSNVQFFFCHLFLFEWFFVWKREGVLYFRLKTISMNHFANVLFLSKKITWMKRYLKTF